MYFVTGFDRNIIRAMILCNTRLNMIEKYRVKVIARIEIGWFHTKQLETESKDVVEERERESKQYFCLMKLTSHDLKPLFRSKT